MCCCHAFNKWNNSGLFSLKNQKYFSIFFNFSFSFVFSAQFLRSCQNHFVSFDASNHLYGHRKDIPYIQIFNNSAARMLSRFISKITLCSREVKEIVIPAIKITAKRWIIFSCLFFLSSLNIDY